MIDQPVDPPGFATPLAKGGLGGSPEQVIPAIILLTYLIGKCPTILPIYIYEPHR